MDANERVARMKFSDVYPLYIQKVERKGRTAEDVDTVITWLTGFDDAALRQHLDAGLTFEEFFAAADLNPKVSHINGVICGVRIENIENPLMKKARYLDKLVDELAKGRPMEKVLRENV